MKLRSGSTTITSLVVIASVAVAPLAAAESVPRVRTKAPSTLQSISRVTPSPGRTRAPNLRSAPRTSRLPSASRLHDAARLGNATRSRDGARLGNSGRSRDGGRTLDRSNRLNGVNDLLSTLYQLENRGRYDDYFDPYRRHDEDEMAKAYRDVGIANAIVNLVGVIATIDANQRVQRPAGGRYVQEKFIIKEGYYEEYEVWVPDTFDERTRETIKAHTEVRQRWVPEVYGYRDVWVPDGR